MADDIDKLRREIDAVDDELLKLINRRAALAGRIGSLKQGAPAYRPSLNTTPTPARQARDSRPSS